LLDAGTGIGAFAFPLVTFMVTGELGITGLVALVQGLGALAGLIPGGLLADRVERRRLRLLAGATGAVIQGVLVLVLLTGGAGPAPRSWRPALALTGVAGGGGAVRRMRR